MIGQGRGGRRRANLSFEAEEKLLGHFFEKANRGEILVVNKVKAAYEVAVGHRVPNRQSTECLLVMVGAKLLPGRVILKLIQKNWRLFKNRQK